MKSRYLNIYSKIKDYCCKHDFLLFLTSLSLAMFLVAWLSYGLSEFLCLPWAKNWQMTVKYIRWVWCFFLLLSFFVLAKILYYWKPVKRDRIMFAHRGGGMLAVSGVVSFGVICLLYSMARTWVTDPHSIYHNTDIHNVNDNNLNHDVFWDVISQFADPGNLPQSNDKLGMTVALLSAMAGVVCLSGLLVSSFVSLITRRTQRWRQGLIRYNRGFYNYVVIIGSNEQTASIVKSSLRRKEIGYVLIQTKKIVEEERAKLDLYLEHEDEDRVVFYSGDRILYEDIKDLHLEYAEEIYILGEDMAYSNEEDHDAYNITCLEHISRYMKENDLRVILNDDRLKCHVNFEYQSTFMAFKFTHIYRSLNEGHVEFLPFNVYELWAKKILVDNSAIIPIGKHGESHIMRYLPLDAYWKDTPNGNNKKLSFITEDSDKCVHLVIIGMNQIGVALAMETALLVHLPNYTTRKRRTTITFIDENAQRESELLMSRYSALFDLCRYRMIKNARDLYSEKEIYDIWNPEDDESWTNPMKKGRFSHVGEMEGDNFIDLQWEFIEDNVVSPKIRNYLSALTNDRRNRTCTIAVCFNNPQKSIATALYLPETVLRKSLQILVYQRNALDMTHLIATSEKEWKRYEKLKPFGMIDGSYMGGIFDNVLAKFANLLYTDEGSTLKPGDNMDDTWLYRAERLWDELGIVDKLANIDLVDSFNMKLRSAGIRFEDVANQQISEKKMNALIDTEHRRWLLERLTMGYRPVTKEELNDILSNDPIKNKQYYKNKSRAHIDICHIQKVKEWDRAAFEKNQDKRILDMMTTMLVWEQWAILRQIYTDKSENQIVKSIVEDMVAMPTTTLWVSCHTVSKSLWKSIMGSVPSGNDYLADSDPVINVSKCDVDDFLLTLTKKTGLRLRLPTSEEWNKVNNEAEKLKLYGMEGDVWQWTGTIQGDSAYVICGQSKSFKENQWKEDEFYWFPNFKSDELGFRLFASFPFSPKDVSSRKRHYNLEDDYKHVVRELQESMVFIKGSDVIPSFWILPNPVSQRQWKAVKYLAAKHHDKLIEDNYSEDNPSLHRGDYYPVDNVSFTNAVMFIIALRRVTGEKYRLPTEKEWKFAAQQFKCDEKAFWDSGVARTTRRILRPQYFKKQDLYDMYGGVWEWCVNGNETILELLSKNVRVLRGGSWRLSKKDILEAYKEKGRYWLSDYSADDVGFRIVISEEDFNKDSH